MDKVCKEFRPLHEAERKFTFSQGFYVWQNSGAIGYLRADFGASGNEFWSTWNDICDERKTDRFKAEFDRVINGLREKGEALSSRSALASLCYGNPECAYEDGRNHYGFRLDTEDYAYLMRFNPNRGDYNLYCYCYERDMLDRHLERAARGIPFKDWEDNELFRVPDGGTVQVVSPDGGIEKMTCRYISQDLVEVDKQIYYIPEFVELIEEKGGEFFPVASKEQALAVVQAVLQEAREASGRQAPGVHEKEEILK